MSACGEVLYSVFENIASITNKEIPFDVKYLVYTAISSDTGCFRFSNTTVRTFEIAAKLAASLREEGIGVQYDVAGRSVKAQMKFANKLGVRNTVVIGDSEIETGKVTVKDMDGGESVEIRRADLYVAPRG